MKRFLAIISIIILGSVMSLGSKAFAAGPLEIYTPYSGISVTPGESIDYNLDLINNTNDIQTVSFDVNGLPDTWEYSITSGGWEISKLSVKPDQEENFSLKVDVPLKVEKGTYQFSITTNGNGSLQTTAPFTVKVTETGTYKTELNVEQPNMEGHADSSFTYSANLENKTPEEQRYSLKAKEESGWKVSFESGGKSVTSVVVKPNESKDITITVEPPENIKKGKYEIPITATAGSISAKNTLEAVVTGSYDLKLSTPSGRLSTDITAGDEKTIQLEITNTGTSTLHDISIDSSTPVDWKVSFEEEKVTKLEPGKSITVDATITAPDSSIAGDYVVTMDATAPEASSEKVFRVSVKTSVLWGWFGMLIIVAVIGGIFYLFRKYGRR